MAISPRNLRLRVLFPEPWRGPVLGVILIDLWYKNSTRYLILCSLTFNARGWKKKEKERFSCLRLRRRRCVLQDFCTSGCDVEGVSYKIFVPPVATSKVCPTRFSCLRLRRRRCALQDFRASGCDVEGVFYKIFVPPAATSKVCPTRFSRFMIQNLRPIFDLMFSSI